MKRSFRAVAVLISAAMIVCSLCGCSLADALVSGIEAFSDSFSSALTNGTEPVQESGEVPGIFSFDDDTGTQDDPYSETNTDADFRPTNPEEIDAENILSTNIGECSGEVLLGSWIDIDGDYLTFYDDGTVNWYGETVYNYSFDGQFFRVYSEDESFEVLARVYDDIFVYYNDPYYFAHVFGVSGQLDGRWESSDEHDYSFDFGENSRFLEDDIAEGTYYVYENDLLLVYDDSYVSYCIFLLMENDQLGVAYGWPLQRVS